MSIRSRTAVQISSQIRVIKLITAVILLHLIAPSVQAATIHVPGNVSTIRQAIKAANNGDTVLVSPGIYVEQINFKRKAITVRSEAGHGNTIIDT